MSTYPMIINEKGFRKMLEQQVEVKNIIFYIIKRVLIKTCCIIKVIIIIITFILYNTHIIRIIL